MKKDKQKAQVKADRKKAEKVIKATLITELTTLASKFAEPSKKLKKLIEKSASAFAKEINKNIKPAEKVATEKPVETTETATPAKVSKPRAAKKTEKETAK
ncbi:hypothetical protein [Pedobacter nanyangensis]|uniref:hypothetical protein n=1 Tax=Pedobacter nanyangensis TaxID=1562389 RepID=UPI000DE243A4|nr:hypothetical protein [Pedobacter nanyangensis]